MMSTRRPKNETSTFTRRVPDAINGVNAHDKTKDSSPAWEAEFETIELSAAEPQKLSCHRRACPREPGRVLQVRDRRLGRTVGVKELIDDTGDAERRFVREARLTARRQHS